MSFLVKPVLTSEAVATCSADCGADYDCNCHGAWEW